MSMLEYSKLILEKVSFDMNLFAREFKKAISYLVDNEIKELTDWCIHNFGYEYYQVCTT